jgi:collagenase-like PrtC family protease
MSIANDFNDNIDKTDRGIAHYHLPGLFEFYEFYKVFLPLFYEHREYFYDWCDIGSIYGAPADCIWGGGRAGFGEGEAERVFSFVAQYGISARLTFSNSLIRKEHLADIKCNKLCELLEAAKVKNGIIVHSDILLDYLKNKYPEFYFVSSTTKVLTDYNDLLNEVNRDDFSYVVPDFRLNKCFDKLGTMTQEQKDKIEFLCNECCWIGCYDRKACYEAVSRMNLGENCNGHICVSSEADEGYRFSKAMHNPAFISVDDIRNIYMPMGFTNFKIEGRSLGSALVLEFLLYYMTKPEYQINVREEIYLDNTLDIF